MLVLIKIGLQNHSSIHCSTISVVISPAEGCDFQLGDFEIAFSVELLKIHATYSDTANARVASIVTTGNWQQQPPKLNWLTISCRMIEEEWSIVFLQMVDIQSNNEYSSRSRVVSLLAVQWQGNNIRLFCDIHLYPSQWFVGIWQNHYVWKKNCHSCNTAGWSFRLFSCSSLGVTEMGNRARMAFFWPEISVDIEEIRDSLNHASHPSKTSGLPGGGGSRQTGHLLLFS